MKRYILHIDMDAFFAAIEQLDFPEYRGKPVIVGADPKEGMGRGVVSTCSYEARKFGIHSAMPISQAYKRCPHGVFVRGRMKRYQDVSHNFIQLLYNYSSDVEPISIDEAFLDISGSIKLLGSPEEIAQKIKQNIRTELQLTASIGIAPNKFIAKIASDLKKPDGLVIVKEKNVKSFLHPLPISKMWGVGKKTEPILINIGIRTIGDLASYSKEHIVKKLGKQGLHFWNLANGIDERDVIPYTAAKSVSHEITFDTDTTDYEKMRNTLFYICSELGLSLHKDNLQGKTITLKIRLDDFSTFTRSKSCREYINSSDVIFNCAFELFKNFDRQGKKVRLLGVAISNLCDKKGAQISIFENAETKKKDTDSLIEKIQEKFGKDSIKRASLMNHKPHQLSDKKLKPSQDNSN